MQVKFFKEEERRGFQQLGDHVSLFREKIPENLKLTGGPRVVRVVDATVRKKHQTHHTVVDK